MTGRILGVFFLFGLLGLSLTGCTGGGPSATPPPDPSPPTIPNSNNPNPFVVGLAGTDTFVATGTPAPTLSETGALPATLTFTNNGNGTATLSGTPAAGTAGTFPITITASNGVGANATRNFTLTVNQAAAITSANSTSFAVGSPGSFSVTTTGSPAPTLSESGNLPSGVTFNPATGILSGTPTVGGAFAISFTAHNGAGTDATQNFTLSVNQNAGITSGNSATLTVGVAASFAVTATGFPAPTLSEAGALPNGVLFTAGTLAGTPTAGTTGTYPITITAHNGVGADAAQNFTLTVNQAAAITSANSTSFVVGSQSSFTVTTTGSPAPTLAMSGALPSGITFTAATGMLAGTPVAGTANTYPITFTAHNGVGADATQAFTLIVTQAAAITSPTGPTVVTFMVGTAGTFPITASGVPTPTLSETGALPSAVTFVDNKNGTGTLGGTPAPGTVGSFSITITAHNGVGADATQTLTLAVTKGTATVTLGTLAQTYDGTPEPVSATTSPSGLTVTFSYSGSGGTVYGPLATAPTSAGSYAVTGTVSDPNYSGSGSGTLTIGKATAAVTLGSLAQTYDGTPKAASATTVPPGLTVTFSYTGSGGTVYGPSTTAPTVAGSYTVTGTVNDPNYSGIGTGTITIGKATPAITWATPAGITYGTALSSTQLNATATGAGGTALPGSFVYTPALGTIVAAGSQTLSVTFTPTDTTDYSTVTKTVTLAVSQATPAITWATPAGITYGTALSSTQLNAAATGAGGTALSGSFVYTPALGTIVAAGSHTLSVTFTPTDTTDYSTVTKTVTLAVSQATPAITWATPAGITYGTALSSTQLNATATGAGGTALSGSFVYTPAAGTIVAAGSHTLSVTFTPTDTTDYSTVTKTVTLAVSQATPAITWATPAGITYGTALSSTQLNATATGAGGTALSGSFVYTPALGTILAAGSQTLSVTFTPTDTTDYSTVTKTVTLAVSQATPAITWATPAGITYGTALSSTQLNATATGAGGTALSGSFVYTPAAGTILAAGSQTLSVTFTPTDTTDYSTVTKTVTLAVSQATPAITWATPAGITYGTALSSTQLNATATGAGGTALSGSFVYTPALGTIVAAGSHTLSVTFTPTDTTDYSTVTKTVTLAVSQATPAITWATPAGITYGTALSSTQLNATATGAGGTALSGSFVYTPALGTIVTAGSHTLSVTFTPTDTTDYSTVTKTVTLAVSQATPAITWATPAGITYGTALSSTQLNATATGAGGTALSGSFVYTPALGTIVAAGSHTLSVTFTPTDTTDYSTVTKTVTLAVSQATPAITWATPAGITYGTALSSTQLNATATGAGGTALSGSFVYTPALGTIVAAGSHTLSVTFTPTDTTDYTTATKTVTITVDLAASITSAIDTTFTAGTAGSFTVTATGYPTPTLSESGVLPSGVTFNSATGVFGGTPAAGTGGTYPVTFTAHNGVGADATQAFTLTINQISAITSSNLTKFTLGTMGTFTVTATGFPAPALSESGALPSGVTFNSATGVLGGTPAAGTTGSYALFFTAHNGIGADTTQNFTLSVVQPAAITSANSVIFGASMLGSFTVTATGLPTPALSEIGTLPTGITFTASSGLLGGTPAAGTEGNYSITFDAHNGVGADAVQSFTLIVGQAAVITSASAVTFDIGALDSFTVTATGSPTPALSETGALPNGVTFNNSTGVLSGTPAAGTAGNYSITFAAQNGVGTGGTQNFTLTVGQGSNAPSINSPNNATFVVGTAGSIMITATGSPTPALSETGALPSGVTFNASTGMLGGTPAVGSLGSYPITFTAANGVGTNATQNFTLTVNSAPAISTEPQNLTVNAGQTATFMVAVTGSAPLTYQWQSNSVNISGANSSSYTTPVTTGNDDGTQFTVVVSNPLGSVISTVATLSVNTPPTITVSPANQTVAVGETATFTVSVSVTGTLPLTYEWLENNASISGATSTSYTTQVTVQADSGEQFSAVVSNSLGTASSNTATLTVVQPTSPATYYVDFASGADTNSGLSKDAPWQYAPGMSSCANNCIVFGLQPGDKVIFKGGVTWDATGFPLVVNASGASGSPIYYGVDQTWFAGNTWSRPAFDLSNSTWYVAPILTSFANFVTFDNLEIKNEEVDNSGSWPPRSSITVDGGSNVTIQNCYIHGWSIQQPMPGSDNAPNGAIAFYNGSAAGAVQNCVLDGSPESDSGVGIYGGTSIQRNVIENVPNGIVVTDPAATVSGNQVFDVPYSVDPSESSYAIFASTSGLIYNNIVHDLVAGAFGLYLEAGASELGNTQYVYNNLVWNVGDNAPIVIASDILGPNSPSNQSIYNNTLSGGTTAGCMSVNPNVFLPTNLTVQNNHCISELPTTQAWCWNQAGGSFGCGSVTNLIFGNNVLMTTELAASSGYTLTDSFQPTASNSATVGVGLNLVSNCVTIGSSLCSDRLGVVRPGGSTAWDAGAYQYQTVAGSIAPIITLQPVRQEVPAGQTATFSVIAAGSAPLNYQWQQNGTAISGATSSTYISPATSVDGTLFTVVVRNAAGSVTSSPALLSVSAGPGQLTPNPPTGLNFGTVSIGTASPASVTLTNTSSDYITISNISVAGPGFSASGVPSGIILAPGEAATLNVVFAPSGTGSVAGSVTISSDAAGSPTTIPLSGTGINAPHLVNLTWNPSTSSVFGYYLYRATNQYGPYTRLDATPVAATQYTDITVVPGQTYLYWVTAVDSDTLESPFSDSVTVVVPTP